MAPSDRTRRPARVAVALAFLASSASLTTPARADGPAPPPGAALAPTPIPPGSGEYRPTFNPDREPAPKSSGLMLGATLAYSDPFILNDLQLAAGPAIGLSAGYRWTIFYFGASYQHAFFSSSAGGHDGTTWTNSGGQGDYVGADFVVLSDPDATIAFLSRCGLGYRVVGANADQGGISGTAPVHRSGLDATVAGVGLQIKPNPWLRLVPEASLSIGEMGAFASVGLTTYFDFGHTDTKSLPDAATATATSESPPPARPRSGALPETRALTERPYTPGR